MSYLSPLRRIARHHYVGPATFRISELELLVSRRDVAVNGQHELGVSWCRFRRLLDLGASKTPTCRRCRTRLYSNANLSLGVSAFAAGKRNFRGRDRRPKSPNCRAQRPRPRADISAKSLNCQLLWRLILKIYNSYECVVAREDSNLQPDRYERHAFLGRSRKIRYLGRCSATIVHVWCGRFIGETLVMRFTPRRSSASREGHTRPST